jgi:hypothetical protein
MSGPERTATTFSQHRFSSRVSKTSRHAWLCITVLWKKPVSSQPVMYPVAADKYRRLTHQPF